LAARPEELFSSPYGSEFCEVRLQRGGGVNEEIEGGHPTKEQRDGGRHHAASAGHALHLGDDLLDLRDDVERQRRHGRIEFAICEPKAPDIALLIGDVGMGPAAVRAFEVSLRRIDPDHMRSGLG
jgi:hypothetical protein